MLESLEAKLIAAAVIFVLAFGAGWKLRDYQATAAALDAANTQLQGVKDALVANGKISEADAEKSKTLEELIASIRDSKQKVQVIREKEYVEKNVYSKCVLPPSGVQLINDAINHNRAAADPGER